MSCPAKCFPIIFFSLSFAFLHAQKSNVMFGIGGLYDFQDKGAAIDSRAMIPVRSHFYITPRISFFPSFNNVHELYGGADFDYFFLKRHRINPYVFAGGYADDWFNYKDFSTKKAKQLSIVPEGGAGIIFGRKCFHPYIEYRYDAHWQEGSLGAGIILKFGGCFGGGAGNGDAQGTSKRSANHCPHF